MILLSQLEDYKKLLDKIRTLPCQDSIPIIILKDQHIIRNVYPIAVCESPIIHPKQKHFISIDNDKVYLNYFQDENRIKKGSSEELPPFLNLFDD